MLVENKINRYVERVGAKVSPRDRKAVEEKLKSMIYDMLEDYCDGNEPDILDVRKVLDELGSPEELAESYYDNVQEKRKAKLEVSNMPLLSKERIFYIVNLAFSVLSAILVVSGLIALATHRTENMTAVFAGLIMALVVAVVKAIRVGRVFEE